MTSCVSTLTSRSVFSPMRVATAGGEAWLASAGGWGVRGGAPDPFGACWRRGGGVLDAGPADLSGVSADGVVAVVGAGLGTGLTTKACQRESDRKHKRNGFRKRLFLSPLNV